MVVITGASSGIGEALAHEFYSYGCKVVLAARRIGELERVRRNLLNTKLMNGVESIRPEIVPLDLIQIDQLTDKAHQILRSNLHVDYLINNGGVSLRSDALNVKQDVDIQLMNVNYFGAVALTKGMPNEMLQTIIIAITNRRRIAMCTASGNRLWPELDRDILPTKLYPAFAL